MATLMLVHAHPDDESISTGGVMMKAKSHGHRVVNVTATRGEAGEIYNMDEAQSRPRLGEIRTGELKAADEVITTRVDVHDYVQGKREAFRAHRSQNDPNSWFATMQDQIYELAFGTEYYQLVRGKAGSDLPEPDLFAGIA